MHKINVFIIKYAWRWVFKVPRRLEAEQKVTESKKLAGPRRRSSGRPARAGGASGGSRPFCSSLQRIPLRACRIFRKGTRIPLRACFLRPRWYFRASQKYAFYLSF